MASNLLLTGLPESVITRIRAFTENMGLVFFLASSKEACQERLLNTEVVGLIIDADMVTGDPHVLDVIQFYSNKVQVVLYLRSGEHNLSLLQMKSVVGILIGEDFTEGMLLSLVMNMVRFYGLEARTEELESSLRDNQAVATELDLKNKVFERERNFNESIINSIVYGLMIVDTVGAIMMLNEMGKKIFGVSVSDFYGQQYGEVVFNGLKESLSTNAAEVLKSGETRQIEGCSVREDLMIAYSISLIKDNYENPVGLLFLARDVTEWEQMTNQLFQAEKLATMGTMLSGIAHELRNPITIINTRAQRLLANRDALNEKIIKAVESIETQSNRCGDIINNLLDFSRKKVAGFTLVNINEVIESALAFLTFEKRFDGIDV